MKRSFLLSIAVTFALGYALSNLGHFVFSNLKFQDEFNRRRTVDAMNELKLGVTLLKHEEVDGLAHHLDDQREAHVVDFYLIRRSGKTLTFGNADNDLAAIDISYVPNRIVMNDRVAYGAVTSGDYLLVVGVKKTKSDFLKEMLRENRGSLLIDCLIVTLMALGIVIFFFRDIRELLRIFRARDRKGLTEVRPGATKEAVVMARGMKAYENQIRRLQTDRKRLSKQVHPSLRTELDSGIEPPYQFRCVMVRTDINQYSTIYSTYPVEEFMTFINEFFSRASFVIDRYQGYVTDFVGDEIIYYFKEDDHENAAAIALAAIRDVHAIAEDIHQRTLAKNGYPFRVKSAAACGSLRFGPQVHGFALSGGVFVETVRILSQVEEKSQSSVYLPSRLALRVAPVCTTAAKKSIELRGVPGLTHLHTVSEFRECSAVLADLTESAAMGLQYYRSDEDLLKIFAALRAQSSHFEAVSTTRKALQALRLIATASSNTKVRDAFASLLSQLLDHWLDSENTAARHLVSAIITVSTRLVAKNIYNETLRRLLGRGLSSPDRRILSNSIDAFIHFEPTQSYGMLSRLIRHPDNRVMANALIKQGIIQLDDKLIVSLQSMIQSSDPLYQASGAFAIGEIAQYYRAEDPTFLETHLLFREL